MRKNRILLEIDRAIMIESHIPKYFWLEVMATAVYLINQSHTKVVNLKTPLHTLGHHIKILSSLTLQPQIFVCTVYVHISKTTRTKLDPFAIKWVFIEYGVHKKGYRCLDPVSSRIYTTSLILAQKINTSSKTNLAVKGRVIKWIHWVSYSAQFCLKLSLKSK